MVTSKYELSDLCNTSEVNFRRSICKSIMQTYTIIIDCIILSLSAVVCAEACRSKFQTRAKVPRETFIA